MSGLTAPANSFNDSKIQQAGDTREGGGVSMDDADGHGKNQKKPKGFVMLSLLHNVSIFGLCTA